MPANPFLAETELKFDDIATHLKVNKMGRALFGGK